MTTRIPARIHALREAMDRKQIDAYIIPSSDPHLSEYPADRWKSREWLSGFDGSAGTLVVTADKAGLWTDSRYFLQADMQLQGSGIELYKASLPETPSITDFLLNELSPGKTVGLDGFTYSAAEGEHLEKLLGRKGIVLETAYDLVDLIWKDRPAIPGNSLFEMPEELSGKRVSEKLNEINDLLHKEGADCLLLGALDEIAWTFNIRGTDVAYNPVAISYGFVSEEESILFIDPKKMTAEVAEKLKKEGVTLADYARIQTYLSRLSNDKTVYIDAKKTNLSLFNAIPKGCKIIEGLTPTNHLKSIKNETEIKGFRNALLKDGIALTKFYIWLEKQMTTGETVTELSASEKLTSLRAEQAMYLMDSFSTICGYAGHGAIVHYSPTPESNITFKPEGLLLMDSGAQYMDGTTDITRTIALGEPTEQMKKDFTRTLKGMISIAKCKFPEGTRGCQIDILARKALWDAGIQYLHGTSHGIGHCLNVHEGPQSIRMDENPVSLKPGMIMSNEPAMYRTGEYGIRIENMILTQNDSETEWGKFLCFDTLTLCYIDTRLVLVSMLSAREHAWLNKYHQKVYELLSPHLNEEEKAWLKEKTREV
ncbi:aminopeptidase P family protein [Parabacteroides sp. 52]|uniref:aminopeptidase P family protein n=1 Tax=unclassified Parabacteroides TaxID=2649774 RepID=UPI0013D6B43A|nr:MULTISPECIES: aminopeptidase P family protein [unclassified Parabacteroides]NDV55346.1 aminopeptidase P family protein [Parabacteroides sp. 52]